MDIPSDVINAVKETKQDLAEKPTPKTRKPYVKKLTKRILHAIGNGLRTTSSIANALGVDKMKIHSNMSHIKAKGLVTSVKQEGKNEHKYYLNTEKPVLGQLDLSVKPKRKLKAVKRKVAKVAKVAKVVSVEKVVDPDAPRRLTKEEVQLKQDMARLIDRIASLEVSLTEKEKEVWTLECEVFDKKAIIKYLEEKLFVLGVRV